MTDAITILHSRMEAAASALDFEEAKRCRDEINLLRGGASPEDVAQVDFADLTRQKPGQMGLGTSRGRPATQPGWKPPAKPDLMTTGRSTRRGKPG